MVLTAMGGSLTQSVNLNIDLKKRNEKKNLASMIKLNLVAYVTWLTLLVSDE